MTLGATTARAGDDAQKARELFTQGNTYFDLGQFDKAIDAWQQGYQLKNDPGFLYNIAQAYRTMGDAQKAIFFYKRYLSNAPKAHNRAEVEQKIDALQKQISVQEQAKGLPPPGPFGPDNPGANGHPGATAAAAAGDTTAPAATAPPAVTVTGTGTAAAARQRDASRRGGGERRGPDRGAAAAPDRPARRAGVRHLVVGAAGERQAVVRLHAGRRLHLRRARRAGALPPGRAVRLHVPQRELGRRTTSSRSSSTRRSSSA